MGTSGNRDCHWASRSVLKDFTEDALTISPGSLFQNGSVRIVKANWRLQFQLAEETFDPAYYNGGNAVSSEFV